MSQNRVLVFSIATNGYDEVFKDNLVSQQDYADRHRYEFKVFTGSPPGGISGSDSAWLKVPLIIKAFKEGYDWIVFFDADCKLFDTTPTVDSVFKEGKEFYMALDCRADIPNTGVMIFKRGARVEAAFKKILLLSDLPTMFLPHRTRALYEMGHIVHFTRDKDFFEIIDQRWNDTVNKYPDKYVLHAHGQYSRKARSKERPLTAFESLLVRLKKGLRTFRLRRYATHYWK